MEEKKKWRITSFFGHEHASCGEYHPNNVTETEEMTRDEIVEHVKEIRLLGIWTEEGDTIISRTPYIIVAKVIKEWKEDKD